jgi:colanic acid biosynthesis protein WcaH
VIHNVIKALEDQVQNPKIGLPEEVFLLVGRLTPFVNVDLLIEDPERGVLLTWRDDQYTGKGWHFPGGIIRYKETASERAKMVATLELGIEVRVSEKILAVNEIIAEDQIERAHFISLLFRCDLCDEARALSQKVDWQAKHHARFFKKKPDNLLSWHEIYSWIFDNR